MTDIEIIDSMINEIMNQCEENKQENFDNIYAMCVFIKESIERIKEEIE